MIRSAAPATLGVNTVPSDFVMMTFVLVGLTPLGSNWIVSVLPVFRFFVESVIVTLTLTSPVAGLGVAPTGVAIGIGTVVFSRLIAALGLPTVTEALLSTDGDCILSVYLNSTLSPSLSPPEATALMTPMSMLSALKTPELGVVSMNVNVSGLATVGVNATPAAVAVNFAAFVILFDPVGMNCGVSEDTPDHCTR